MPGTMVSRGNLLNSFLIGPTLTPVSVAGNTTAEQNFTILGLQMNDSVGGFSFNGAVTNQDVGIVNLRVSAANILTIAFQNGSGGALTPQAGQYIIEINRPEAAAYSALPTNAA